MKNLLEELVPSLANCRRIRPEWFADSQLCWKESFDYGQDKPVFKVERNYKWEKGKKFPAPTFNELREFIGEDIEITVGKNGFNTVKTKGLVRFSEKETILDSLLELAFAINPSIEKKENIC